MGKKATGDVYQLKITLKRITPPVWRRVQVRDCNLYELHVIIQAVMGWDDSHMHAFDVGGQQFSLPDPDGFMDAEDEEKVKLRQIVAAGHKKFTYTYDFGDDWDHTILIEKTVAPEPGVHYPRCTAGRRACPPEDCGGPWGYADFLAAINDPAHERHEELREWFGGRFDPEAFDLDAANRKLGHT